MMLIISKNDLIPFGRRSKNSEQKFIFRGMYCMFFARSRYSTLEGTLQVLVLVSVSNQIHEDEG